MKLKERYSSESSAELLSQLINDAKEDQQLVHTANISKAVEQNVNKAISDNEYANFEPEKNTNTDISRFLKENTLYFSSAEQKKYEKGYIDRAVLEDLKKELAKRKMEEEKLISFCSKYETLPSTKNSKFAKMEWSEKKEYFEKLKKLEKHLDGERHKHKRISENRFKLSMKKAINEFNTEDIEILISTTTKLFEKEQNEIKVFDQFSRENGLPYSVRKMSKSSKGFYLEYYNDEDFEIREKLIQDWQIIVNHEESLLKKFIKIFSDYPNEKNKKLEFFQNLDFLKKEKFIENAEIIYPQTTKEKTKTEEESKDKNPTINTVQKKESAEKNREQVEKEAISFALESLKNETPEDGLKTLLSFKKAHGNSAKIKFYIKMLINYIEETEIEEEKKESENEISLKNKAEEKKVSDKIKELFESISLKRTIKEKKIIAKNIRGAMKNEALHKDEKDALKRAKTENDRSFSNETEKKITEKYYKNEKDNFINLNGKSEKLSKLTLSRSKNGLSSDEFFSLEKTTEKHETELFNDAKGFSHINFYDNEGNILSAKQANEIESEKLTKISTQISLKTIKDLKISSTQTQIDLKSLIKKRLFQESKLDELS